MLTVALETDANGEYDIIFFSENWQNFATMRGTIDDWVKIRNNKKKYNVVSWVEVVKNSSAVAHTGYHGNEVKLKDLGVAA